MPNLTTTVSNLDKRVTALETNQTQKDERIIPLIEKLYKELGVSQFQCGGTLCGTISTSGNSSDIINYLKDKVNYIGLGTGSTADEGNTLPNESYRKEAYTEEYGSLFLIDTFIEPEEANGGTYTNIALMINGSSSVGSGLVFVGNSGLNIAKSSDKSLTISTEITLEVQNHGIY